jgi:hypothetical protein
MGLDPNPDLAKPGPGSTTLAFGNKILITRKRRKTYLKHSFRGIALYVVPNGRKLPKHGFFLRKLNSRIVNKAKGDPTNYFI